MSFMKVKEVDSQFLTIITAYLHRSTHTPQHAQVRGTGPHDTNEVLLGGCGLMWELFNRDCLTRHHKTSGPRPPTRLRWRS